MILRTIFSWLAACILACGNLALAQGGDTASNWWNEDVWQTPDRGFNWYPPDPPPPAKPQPKQPEVKPEPLSIKPTPKRLEDIPTVKELREEYERRRDLAIMAPTPENMLEWQRAQKFVLDKSSMFADMQRRTLWANPEVDYNTKSPSANFAQVAINSQRWQDEAVLMNQLARTHGILFFYRSDCQFCHILSPVVKMLQDRYHIEVLAVSGDGGPIKEFPGAKPDNGIASFVSNGRGIEVYPSLYLVSKDKRQVVPLGAGVMAMDEIVSRIYTLLRTQPNQNF